MSDIEKDVCRFGLEHLLKAGPAYDIAGRSSSEG